LWQHVSCSIERTAKGKTTATNQRGVPDLVETWISKNPGHSIHDVLLTPLELIHNNRDSVRKACEAYLIDKAMTLEPRGINRGDELN